MKRFLITAPLCLLGWMACGPTTSSTAPRTTPGATTAPSDPARQNEICSDDEVFGARGSTTSHCRSKLQNDNDKRYGQDVIDRSRPNNR